MTGSDLKIGCDAPSTSFIASISDTVMRLLPFSDLLSLF